MMSKKVISLATIAVFLFAFAMAASADYPNPTAEGSYPAVGSELKQAPNYFELFPNKLPKCTVPSVINKVPCSKAGVQGQVDLLYPFDYDNDVNGVLRGNYGYCPAKGQIINGRAIFDICFCPDACKNITGTKIGLQMEILTQGVYWAKDPKTEDAKNNGRNTVWFNMYPSATPADTICNDKTVPVNNFGEIRYYLKTDGGKFNSKGNYIRTPQTEGNPLGDGSTYKGLEDKKGDGFATIPPENQVKVIESQIDTDYSVAAVDAGKCLFAIDIPAMRLDSSARPGDTIKVRITLLWSRVLDGLCPDCNPPVLCEMVQDIATICCDEADPGYGCIFFPYVLQQNDYGWQTGIAISARGNKLPAGAYCELTLQDSKGNVATYKKTDMGQSLVWAFVLDTIIDKFDKKLAKDAVSLKVVSNYRIDGYAFMNAAMTFGAGEMARACGTACNP